MRLFIDQYGQRYYVASLKELSEKVPGRRTKMYIDRAGKTLHIGYVVGDHWLTEYACVEREAS